jgi:hypothetical protein
MDAKGITVKEIVLCGKLDFCRGVCIALSK